MFSFFRSQERYRQSSWTETEIVYADRPAWRVRSVVALAGWIIFLVCLFHEVAEMCSWQPMELDFDSQDIATSRQQLESYMQDFQSSMVRRALYFAVVIFVFCALSMFSAPAPWKAIKHIWTRSEIILDQINHVVTYRFHHLLGAPTSVHFRREEVVAVALFGADNLPRVKNCWSVLIFSHDLRRRLIDEGPSKEPIRKLGIEFAETLQLPLDEEVLRGCDL